MKIYWSGDAKNIIGPRVKELREKAGLSQEALAGKLSLQGTDFSSLMILRIEKGSDLCQTMNYWHWRNTSESVQIIFLDGQNNNRQLRHKNETACYCFLKRYPTPRTFSM